jgi:pimeloyl-ACP methyl ester carboxylesterase
MAVRTDPARAIEAFFTTMVGVDIWNALSAETKTQRRAEGPALLADLDSAHQGRGDGHQSPVDFDEIGIATQCVYGERSPAHLADSAKYIATMIPSAQLTEMAGASHGPHLSDPVGFAQLVEGFVKSVTT